MTTFAHLEASEEVRVSTFRETSRRRESVVFQGFLKLLPGAYTAQITVRDGASAAGLAAAVELHVPQFGPGAVSMPLIAYRAEPRASREAPPSLILNPWATIEIGGRESLVYFETASPAPAIIQVLDEGEVVWSKEVTPPHEPVALHATLASIDLGELPPGDLQLQVRSDAAAAAPAARLLVTPSPDWLFANYQDLISYLRYAGRAGELDSLRSAPVRERARRFAMFWKSRDPDPDTPENEFFERYFRRIQDANNRFADQTTEGWLTDRGAVYVTLGPPDEVFRHLDQQEGPGRSQIWLYNRSLGFELRLVFVDETGAGAYSLTRDSRLSFLDAVERLYS